MVVLSIVDLIVVKKILDKLFFFNEGKLVKCIYRGIEIIEI